MVIAPSDAAPAQTRGRRGVAASGGSAGKRTRRARSTSGAASSRSGSRKPSSRGASPFASSKKPVRKWVQVRRPPGNSENIKFAIQQWVPIQDLTEEERVIYNVAAENQQLAETPNAAANIEQSSLKKKAAPKRPPRPSSVTFASDTVASLANDTVVSTSATTAAAQVDPSAAAAPAAPQPNQSDITISGASYPAGAALPPNDASSAAVAPTPPQEQQGTVESKATPDSVQKRAAASLEALVTQEEPPVKRQRTEDSSPLLVLEADTTSAPVATNVTTSAMAQDREMPDA